MPLHATFLNFFINAPESKIMSLTISDIPNFVTENNTVFVLYDVIEICDVQLQLISVFDGQIQYNHGYN